MYIHRTPYAIAVQYKPLRCTSLTYLILASQAQIWFCRAGFPGPTVRMAYSVSESSSPINWNSSIVLQECLTWLFILLINPRMYFRRIWAVTDLRDYWNCSKQAGGKTKNILQGHQSLKSHFFIFSHQICRPSNIPCGLALLNQALSRLIYGHYLLQWDTLSHKTIMFSLIPSRFNTVMENKTYNSTS